MILHGCQGDKQDDADHIRTDKSPPLYRQFHWGHESRIFHTRFAGYDAPVMICELSKMGQWSGRKIEIET